MAKANKNGPATKAVHSPDPWVVKAEAGFDYRYLVVQFPASRPTEAELDANGRVVAAAPDLLAACKAMLATRTGTHTQDFGEQTRLDKQAIGMAEAAIAKVEGRE